MRSTTVTEALVADRQRALRRDATQWRLVRRAARGNRTRRAAGG
jgi:hypothetical protein